MTNTKYENNKVLKETDTDIYFDGDVIFRQDFKTTKNIHAQNINARNINARDINAWDINARDIYAWDINARDIYAWNISCHSRKKKTTESKTIAYGIIFKTERKEVMP